MGFVEMPPAFPKAAVSASVTFREDGKEPVELDVSILRVKPGDTLVLRSQMRITHEVQLRLLRLVEQVLPGVKGIVLEDGFTLDGVIRQDT